MKMRLTVVISLLLLGCAPGCIGLFVSTYHPVYHRGEWDGRIVRLPAVDTKTGEAVEVRGLQLADDPAPVKAGNQVLQPFPGSVVVLVDGAGAPARVEPADGPVTVTGIWTDHWRYNALGGRELEYQARDTWWNAEGVLQVTSVRANK